MNTKFQLLDIRSDQSRKGAAQAGSNSKSPIAEAIVAARKGAAGSSRGTSVDYVKLSEVQQRATRDVRIPKPSDYDGTVKGYLVAWRRLNSGS